MDNVPPEILGSTRELLARGDLVSAARREAKAADADGYDVTAELLRRLATALASLRVDALLWADETYDVSMATRIRERLDNS